MRFILIDPPGTWLQNEALFDLLRRHRPGPRFLEIGCGAGQLSKELVRRGYRGVGLDVSPEAVARARQNLAPMIAAERYELHEGTLETLPPEGPFDFALCMLVIEHIPDDVAFVAAIAERVRPGGLVIVAVPGRKDHWCLEDETVGHLRRYETGDVRNTLARAGLEPLDVWSVSVPVANILFRLGNRLIAQSQSETRKVHLDKQVQTLGSGIREVPFKTTFPPLFRLVLNRFTLYPFFLLQRVFYRTRLGVTLIGAGRVQDQTASPKPLRP